MHLIYFDETKNNDAHPHYHIGAVCISEEQLFSVEEKVSELSVEIFGKAELLRETEFHASDIFHRKAAFKDCSNPGERLAVIQKLLKILSMDEISLINIQVNCDRLHEGQDPEEIAFMFLCERASDYMKKKQSLGMLIGDRENDRLSEQYATTLSDYRSDGTGFAFGRPVDHLVDSVHFTHSHLSRFLQLADTYVWISQFFLRNASTDNTHTKAAIELFRGEGIDLHASKYKVWPKN